MYNISLQGALDETHSFAGGTGDGSQPWAGVLLMDGTLYGTTLNGGLTVRVRSSRASSVNNR